MPLSHYLGRRKTSQLSGFVKTSPPVSASLLGGSSFDQKQIPPRSHPAAAGVVYVSVCVSTSYIHLSILEPVFPAPRLCFYHNWARLSAIISPFRAGNGSNSSFSNPNWEKQPNL